MLATENLREAARLMTICNACRYCEGLCAVFPAMEMRRTFARRRPQLSRQSLPRLRRLLFRLPVFAAARIQRQRAGRVHQAAQRQLRGLRLAGCLFRRLRQQRPCRHLARGAEHGRLHRRLCRLVGSGGAVGAQCRRFLQSDAAFCDGGDLRRRRALRRARLHVQPARLLARHQRRYAGGPCRLRRRRGRRRASDLSARRRRRLHQRGRTAPRRNGASITI